MAIRKTGLENNKEKMIKIMWIGNKRAPWNRRTKNQNIRKLKEETQTEISDESDYELEGEMLAGQLKEEEQNIRQPEEK